MTEQNNGGPAFPTHRLTGQMVVNAAGENEFVKELVGGMTLRDYFAAKAIPFIQWNKDNTELCADRCYEIADAMLKARGEV